ncbi:MAG: YihY/virulence factor BrkB family protein [Candidatus Cloacimonadaceae bacterium]
MKRILKKIIPNIPLGRTLLTHIYKNSRGLFANLKNARTHLTNKEKLKLMWRNISALFSLFYKKVMQEGVLKEAAALTYITILGFIPFLLFIVFLIPKISSLSSNPMFQTHLYENFMPVSTGEVGNLIAQLISRKVTFNFFSLIMTIITSYSLFKVIRDTFDRILIMEFKPPKDLLSQLLKFFGTIIFGFVIILVLFSSSSLPIVSSLLDLPLFRKQLIVILPFLMQFLALIFLYMVLPSAKVSRKSLFKGAFWTTLVWVIAKSGFDLYVYNLTNIEAMYGVVKSLPIFLFWIYLNWVIILSGMVLVAILEYKDKALKHVEAKHYVRVTMEMYTNQKMDKQMDAIMKKDDLPELLNTLTEDKKA